MEGTKYNLSITTSGENGDHASTNISTSNPTQLADLLQLAGMTDGHPIALGDVPQSFEEPAHEEHGSCDVCGGMHEDVAEGESWDNEPDEVVHAPEEVTQTGNDLHKVKKTYPKVAGGDNPMALENTENKLRQQFADFLSEDSEEDELVSPWKKEENDEEEKPWNDPDHPGASSPYIPSCDELRAQGLPANMECPDFEDHDEFVRWLDWMHRVFEDTDTDIEIVGEVEEVEEAAGKMKKTKPCPEEKIIENKNMNDIRKLIDNLDSINGNGSTVVTEATLEELQAQQKELAARIAALKAAEPDPWSPEGQAAMAARQQARASKEGGRESGPAGSFTDDDYDDEGNFIGTPLKVFGKAEKTHGREDSNDPKYGSYTDADYDEHGNFIGTPLKVFGKAEKQVGRENSGGGAPSGPYNPRTPGIRARAEGLQARMAAAREAGYPSLKAARAGGHPSGSEHTWTGSGAFEVGGPSDPNRAGAGDGGDGYAVTTPLPAGQPVVGTPISADDEAGSGPGYDDGMHQPQGDPELQDIVKLSGGSWSAEQQAAMAARQAERSARERSQGGGRESGPAGSYTDDDYDEDGKLIRKPLQVFKKPEPRYGPGDSNDPKYGSGKKVGGRTGAEMGGGPGHVDPVFTRPIKSKGREGGREN